MWERHVQSLKSHVLRRYLGEDFLFTLCLFCLAQQGSGSFSEETKYYGPTTNK